jgi:hypothetical protein
MQSLSVDSNFAKEYIMDEMAKLKSNRGLILLQNYDANTDRCF